jgi:hypothetical protein
VVVGPVTLSYVVNVPEAANIQYKDADARKDRPSKLGVEVTDLAGKPTDAATATFTGDFGYRGTTVLSFIIRATFKKAPSQVKLTPLFDGKAIAGVGSKQVDVAEVKVDDSEVKTNLPIYSQLARSGDVMINTRPKDENDRPLQKYPKEDLQDPDKYKATLKKYGFISVEADVTINAPDPKKDLPKLHLGWTRDVTEFGVTIHYADDKTAKFEPGLKGDYPFLDTARKDAREQELVHGTGADTSFANSSTEIQQAEGKKRIVVALDSPGFIFPAKNPGGSAWSTTDGSWKWVDHLTVYSDDAPKTFVVIAASPWGIAVVGKKKDDGTWQSADGYKVLLPKDGKIDTTGLPAPSGDVKTFNDKPPVFPKIQDTSKWVFP